MSEENKDKLRVMGTVINEIAKDLDNSTKDLLGLLTIQREIVLLVNGEIKPIIPYAKDI